MRLLDWGKFKPGFLDIVKLFVWEGKPPGLFHDIDR